MENKVTKLSPEIIKQIIEEEREKIIRESKLQSELKSGVTQLKALRKKQIEVLAEALRIHEASSKLKKILIRKNKEQ